MSFVKTIGHEKQKRLFLRSMQNNSLAHAYALAGEENIGKTTFALELASMLGADPVFDVFVIDQDELITAEEARSLQSRLALAPAGKHKVAVIKADLLTEEASSSLLKTLEEPPAHSVIFLTTSNFYSLLSTIASRVQKIMFSRGTDDDVKVALAPTGTSQEKTEKIVKLAGGRVGFALRLAIDDFFLELVENSQQNYELLISKSLVERLKIAEKIASQETPEVRFFLNYSLKRFADSLAPKDLGKKLYQALSDLESNVNIKLAMDNLFL
ncbi:MAG: hypothetical protein A3C85_00400 [Candidatus Doudnabacteria bacterium RIFCSPHIGHO2_02_FULL_48_21]|uniref:AAA+ ATPase domain-containing protein n=1 Tax=Candidatus Doudnabacteria bacterium RIFCSPLOWO2_02_FULL_48_13 TaxID=1817845 RepID=A0A1F5QCN8_9BACT|nr:MAG: hypothetical protein A3K05_01140 [Candidatus Doudnabacteria bacterium RIFCSPHIGHO2_01_48_18]OGE79175.1 MAG: hypothetical protein A2668_00350 [Candidatus Doudnabacteria bacterium RIFCSPHIGHO2_01_FULL_48_180]OGE91807.1 MAG: hypothetical protein A3F44_00910 [Candidatus Doudnabacteria bacterium RIFCSPHIGHO2_12_FULL_47_25]OGE93657.1 MAG: hypothetical protein A3C85_00400 [Candidatus Doudnabacteria bacterium RIFCSPHIGHO2_02_FULL_48_21]OGE97938.1 MAG: hypothetical protein A3A83_00585 [Candidatu